MALNPAIKLAIGIYILCGVLSFLNAWGAIHTDSSTLQINATDTKFNEMLDPTSLNNGEPLEVQQEQYQTASFDIKGFIMGSVYIKGMIDEIAHYNPVVTSFTILIQAAIYILTVWGFISWVMNRNT